MQIRIGPSDRATSSDELAREEEFGTIELLWGLREPPSRGPKRGLSVHQIAEVGVAIVDSEGLSAISMERVAHELNYTKMALYRYVRSKAELLAVMTDIAIGDPPDLGPLEDGWRIRLERWARLVRAAWNDHPWLPQVSEWQARTGAGRSEISDRVMGPNEVGWVEAATDTLTDMGLSPQEQLDAVFLTSAHLRATQVMTTYGVLPWTLGSPQNDVLERLRSEHKEKYPALSKLSESAHNPEHNAFEFGLARVMDGLELLITMRDGDPTSHPGG